MKVAPQTFKKIDDPLNNESKKYVFYVKIDDISRDIPMATNPRDQKLTSGVAKAIRNSLTLDDGNFQLKNRGIVLSAGKVHFNNKTNEVTIYFDDDYTHGNIDGGHTYKITQEYIGKGLNQYVQFEVMTGVDNIIVELAEARNTSVQVDEKSLAELVGKFDPIKEGIDGLSFYNRIAFKQNQLETEIDPVTGKEKSLKMIDARDVVSILSMFNIAIYNEDKHPMQAYSSKATMLNKFLNDPEEYRKFVNVMPDIFDLFDDIEVEFPAAVNLNNMRYGRKKYAGWKDDKIVAKSKFNQRDMNYKVPDGFVYPILAGFRVLLKYNEDTEKYFFIKPIREVWDNSKVNIAKSVMNFASSIGDNPNAVGKDENIWNLIYMLLSIEANK